MLELPKIIAFVLILFILGSLFRGLYFLVKGHRQDQSAVARSLTYRVAFSACLLLFLVVAGFMGWMDPHRVNPNDALPFDDAFRSAELRSSVSGETEPSLLQPSNVNVGLGDAYPIRSGREAAFTAKPRFGAGGAAGEEVSGVTVAGE